MGFFSEANIESSLVALTISLPISTKLSIRRAIVLSLKKPFISCLYFNKKCHLDYVIEGDVYGYEKSGTEL